LCWQYSPPLGHPGSWGQIELPDLVEVVLDVDEKTKLGVELSSMVVVIVSFVVEMTQVVVEMASWWWALIGGETYIQGSHGVWQSRRPARLRSRGPCSRSVLRVNRRYVEIRTARPLAWQTVNTGLATLHPGTVLAASTTITSTAFTHCDGGE